MVDLTSSRPNRDCNFTGAADPTTSTVAAIGQTYQRTTAPFEEFTCFNIIGGTVYEWTGSLGTKVLAPAAILATNHPNLLAMYTMDNISGSTLVDESPNTNDSTITGAIAVAGKIDNALNFDGNDYTDDSNAIGLALNTEHSVSLWARWSGTSLGYLSTYTDLLVLPDSYSFAIINNFLTTGNLSVISGNTPVGNRATSFSTSLNDNVYHHIVATVGSTVLKLYIDGVNQTDGLVGPVSASPPSLFIGSNWVLAGADQFYDGEIDQFRFFDKVLDQTEVTELFDEGTP